MQTAQLPGMTKQKGRVRKARRGHTGGGVSIWCSIIPKNKVVWVGADRRRSLVIVYAEECIDYDYYSNLVSDIQQA